MPKVAITGWAKGCNTVDAVKQIREKASVPLNEALEAVNRVLRNEQVILPVSSDIVAASLVEALVKVGIFANDAND